MPARLVLKFSDEIKRKIIEDYESLEKEGKVGKILYFFPLPKKWIRSFLLFERLQLG